jgi:PPOX class probable FMN-dependent enzyme
MTVADTYPPLREFVQSEAELEAVMGAPNERMRNKVIGRLDDVCRAYIARSSFLLIASADAAGRMDVSPKGDPAGFVRVLNDHTLAVPERPGNRRADTFHNVLQNPKVGLIFLVPGRGETLRVNGHASIARDAWLLESMAMHGRAPGLALVVTVEEAFMHCTKCMVRSRIWQPDSWQPDGLPNLAEATKAHVRTDLLVPELEAIVAENIRTSLY